VLAAGHGPAERQPSMRVPHTGVWIAHEVRFAQSSPGISAHAFLPPPRPAEPLPRILQVPQQAPPGVPAGQRNNVVTDTFRPLSRRASGMKCKLVIASILAGGIILGSAEFSAAFAQKRGGSGGGGGGGGSRGSSGGGGYHGGSSGGGMQHAQAPRQ